MHSKIDNFRKCRPTGSGSPASPHPVAWGQFDPSQFQKGLYTTLFITRFCAFKIAFGGICLGPLQNNLR